MAQNMLTLIILKDALEIHINNVNSGIAFIDRLSKWCYRRGIRNIDWKVDLTMTGYKNEKKPSYTGHNKETAWYFNN